jgi:hypothetical protein
LRILSSRLCNFWWSFWMFRNTIQDLKTENKCDGLTMLWWPPNLQASIPIQL